MNMLILLSSADPEVKWNAVRFGNTMLENNDDVTLFLNASAVDLYAGDGEQFPIAEQVKLFSLSEGQVLA